MIMIHRFLALPTLVLFTLELAMKLSRRTWFAADSSDQWRSDSAIQGAKNDETKKTCSFPSSAKTSGFFASTVSASKTRCSGCEAMTQLIESKKTRGLKAVTEVAI